MKQSVLRCLYVVKVRVTWKYSILFHALLLVPVLLFSQEEHSVRNTHCLSFETVNSQVKENILMPKVNRGQGIELMYRFEKERNSYNEFTFNIGYSKLKTKLETEKATFNINLGLSYSWGKNLIAREKVKYYLGVNAGYNLAIMEYSVWDESRAYWGTSLTAGPFNRLNVSLNNQCSWISSFHIGLLGIMSRPEEVRLYAQEQWTLLNIMKITNSNFFPGIMNTILICDFKSEYRIPIKDDNFFSFYGSVFYETVSRSGGQPLQILQITTGIGLGF